MTKTPDHKDIERLLGGIQPTPSDALDERLQAAPWNQPDEIVELPVRGRNHDDLLRVAAAIVLMLFTMTVLLSSPAQTFARQVLSLFFSPTPNLTYERPVATPMPTATIAPAVLEATIAARRPEIADLQSQTSVEIKLPSAIPDGYTYNSGYVDNTGTVHLTYLFESGDRIRRFLNLRYVAGEPHAMRVGENAVIQQVTINDSTGEYVQGSWSTGTVTETTDDTMRVISEWDNNLEYHLLIWVVDGVQYEIFYQASLYTYFDDGLPDEVGYLTLDDLIAIAESIHR